MYSSSHFVDSHLEEECFLGLLQEDLAVFLRRRTLNKVLVFPPLSSRLRFLIHKVVEGSPTLASCSIGKEPNRRTVVYFAKKSLIKRNGQYMSSSQEIPRGLSAECSLAGKGRGRGRGRGLGREQRVLSKESSPSNSPNAARRPTQTLYKPGAFRKLKTNNGGSTEETSNAVQSSLSNGSGEVKNSVEKSPIKTKPLRVEKGSSYKKDDLVDQFDVDKEMVEEKIGKGNVIRQTVFDKTGRKPMPSIQNADTCNSAYSCTTDHDVCTMDNSGSTDPVDGDTDSSGYPKTVTLQNADTSNSAYSCTTDHDVCTMDNSGSTDPVDGDTDSSGYPKAVTLQNADTCNSAYSCTCTTDHDVCLMDNSGPIDPVNDLTDNSGFAKAVALQNADTCHSGYSGTTDHDVCSMVNNSSTDPVDGLADSSGYTIAVTLQNADTCNSAYSGTIGHEVCSMVNSGSIDPVDGPSDNSEYSKAVDGLSDNSGSADLAIGHNENTGFTECVIGLTDKNRSTNYVGPIDNPDSVVGSTDNNGSNVLGVDPTSNSSTHHVDFTDSNSSTHHVLSSTDDRGPTNHGVVSTDKNNSTAVGHRDNSGYTDSAVLGGTDNSGSFDHVVGVTDYNGFMYPVIACSDNSGCTDSAVESLIELDKRNSEENKLIDHDMNKFHSSESGASGQDPYFEEMTHLNEAMNVKTPLKEEELKSHKDLADKISTTCTDRKDLRTDVLRKEAGTSENIKDNYATKHKKSKRQCKKEEKAKKKEGKLKKKSKTPQKSDTNVLKKDVGDCLAVVESKTEKQCRRKEDRLNEKNEEIKIEKREEKAKMGEEGSEADWETSWGENGECLNAEILAELNEIVDAPDIEIVKPQFDYLSFKPKDIVLDSGVFDHVAELYDFSPELKTPELTHALSKFKSQGFEIVWVDDTHALAVFSNHKIAQSAIEQCSSPMLKLRPLYDGTQESKLKARRNIDNLQPYKERPKTSKLIANRLVTGALGMKSKMSKEERQLEREKIKAERERKLNKEKQKKDLWESEDLQN